MRRSKVKVTLVIGFLPIFFSITVIGMVEFVKGYTVSNSSYDSGLIISVIMISFSFRTSNVPKCSMVLS